MVLRGCPGTPVTDRQLVWYIEYWTRYLYDNSVDMKIAKILPINQELNKHLRIPNRQGSSQNDIKHKQGKKKVY